MKLFAVLLGLVSCCCSAQANNTKIQAEHSVASEKILIVYLSRTNNTKAVAEIIQEYLGGTIVPLVLVKPYPEDYKAMVAQVVHENETEFLPPLKIKISSIQQYDVVFVGFPTWAMQLPPPMKTFLSQNNLSGKTIIPFNTNGGYGVGSTFDTVKKLCPYSNVMEGFSTKGGIERDGILFVMRGEKERHVKDEVKKWLREIKFIK